MNFGSTWTPGVASSSSISSFSSTSNASGLTFSGKPSSGISPFPSSISSAPAFAAPDDSTPQSKTFSTIHSRPYDLSKMTTTSFHISKLNIPGYPSPQPPLPTKPHGARSAAPSPHPIPPNPWTRLPKNLVTDILDLLLVTADADDIIALGATSKEMHALVGPALRQVMKLSARRGTKPAGTGDAKVGWGMPELCVICEAGSTKWSSTKNIMITNITTSTTPTDISFLLFLALPTLLHLHLPSRPSFTYTLSPHLSLPHLVHFSGPLPTLSTLSVLASAPSLRSVEFIDRDSLVSGDVLPEFVQALGAVFRHENSRDREKSYVNNGVRSVGLRLHFQKGRLEVEGLLKMLAFYPNVEELKIEFEQAVKDRHVVQKYAVERIKPIPWATLEPLCARSRSLKSLTITSKIIFHTLTPSTPTSPFTFPATLYTQPSPISLAAMGARIRGTPPRANAGEGDGAVDWRLVGGEEKKEPGAGKRGRLERIGYGCLWKEDRQSWVDGWGCEVKLGSGAGEELVKEREKGFKWVGKREEVVEKVELEGPALRDSIGKKLEWMLDQRNREIPGFIELVEF